MWRDFYSGCGQADEAATKLIYLVLRDITKKIDESSDCVETDGHPVCHPIWLFLAVDI